MLAAALPMTAGAALEFAVLSRSSRHPPVVQISSRGRTTRPVSATQPSACGRLDPSGAPGRAVPMTSLNAAEGLGTVR
jgi:hypothetical protein